MVVANLIEGLRSHDQMPTVTKSPGTDNVKDRSRGERGTLNDGVRYVGLTAEHEW